MASGSQTQTQRELEDDDDFQPDNVTYKLVDL